MNIIKRFFSNKEKKPLIITFTYDDYTKTVSKRNEKPMIMNDFKTYYVYNKKMKNNNDHNYQNHLQWSNYNQYRIICEIYGSTPKTFEKYLIDIK